MRHGPLTILGAPALTARIHGIVYSDDNENGQHDPGEAGIAGAAVSNQANVVLTSTDGEYELAAAAGTPTLIKIDGISQFRHVASNAREVIATLRKHSLEMAASGVTLCRVHDGHVDDGTFLRLDEPRRP